MNSSRIARLKQAVAPLLLPQEGSRMNIASAKATNGGSNSNGTTNGQAIGIRFTETMRGFFSTSVQDDFQRGFSQGQENNSPFEFTLTVTSTDVDKMLRDPEHTASLSGSVTAPVLSATPMRVISGEFHLFVPDESEVETHLMRSRMLLDGPENERFFFDGFKVVHDDGVLNIWHDTTTLYITLFRGEGPDGPVVGKGILHILPKDFAHQLTTIEAVGAPNDLEGLRAE